MISTAHIIVAQIILAMVTFHIPSYTIERWHTFMIYQANNVITIMYNVFALRRAPWTHNIGCKSSQALPPIYCCMILTRRTPSRRIT